jgi:transcriptional regulator with XRE-family HTH domain
MTADRFAFRLKELRAQAGLTQRELAERAGMTEAGVRNLEQRRTGPTWESVVALAEALGVPTDAFREEPANPSGEKSKRGRPRKEPKADDAQAILETPVRALKDAVRQEREPPGAETGEEPPAKKRGGKRKGG